MALLPHLGHGEDRGLHLEGLPHLRLGGRPHGGLPAQLAAAAPSRRPWTGRACTPRSAAPRTREVAIYIGSYNAKGGKIWWSDVQIEPGGFVNVIRRPSLPLTITSEDGKTVYAEGKDFAEVKDPKLGHDPNPGYFTYWHDAAGRDGSRRQPPQGRAEGAGQLPLRHARRQEPPDQLLLQRAEGLRADREAGPLGQGSRPAGLLLDGARRDPPLRLGRLLRQARHDLRADPGRQRQASASRSSSKADPGKPIVAWNDMFDPFHNARKEGPMYLAKGAGPWYGSWEGLPPSVIVANWHQNNADSLKFFAERGNRADPGRLLRRRPEADRRVARDGRQGQGRLRRDVHHLGRRLLEARKSS